MVDTVQTTTAVLAIVASAGAVALLAVRALATRSRAAGRLGARVVAWRQPLTFAVSAVATLGSLYFSERAGYIPCRLCWFQRVAMYPIAVIALVGLVRRDAAARWYVVPLAVVGATISSYHVAIERGWLAESDSCALVGPSCADVWFESFGFITLAWMALAGFVSIIVLNTVSFRPPADADTRQELL